MTTRLKMAACLGFAIALALCVAAPAQKDVQAWAPIDMNASYVDNALATAANYANEATAMTGNEVAHAVAWATTSALTTNATTDYTVNGNEVAPVGACMVMAQTMNARAVATS